MVNEILEHLPTMQDSELWNVFRDLKSEGEVTDEDYRDVKYGLDTLPFDFVFFVSYNDKVDKLDSWIVDLPSTGRVKVGKNKHHIHDFLEEIDRRRSKMRILIRHAIENVDNETAGRIPLSR